MQSLRRLNPQWVIGISFALLTVFWIGIHLPTPNRAFSDTDDGHQLAGALQILHGEHPFIDYEATYGPLTFYASALAQAIFGQRFIGEIFLITLGYVISYVLLALLIYRITGKVKLVFLFGMLAFFAIPRLYKYYIMLGPLLTIWCAWRYIDRPKLANIFWLAVAVVLAGFFRSDFGVYCTIAATIAVVIQPSYKAGALKRALILLTEIFMLALPYLLFLAFKGGLSHYFLDMVIGGPGIAAGMSMSFPAYSIYRSLFSLSNLMFVMLTFFVCFPFVMTVFLILRWKHLEDNQRKILLPLLVLYLFSLIQTYRFEYKHLLQAIPLAFPLLAWTTNRLWTNITLPRFRLVSIIYLFPLLLIFMVIVAPIFLIGRSGLPPQISISHIPSRIMMYSLPKDDVQLYIGRPTYAEIAKYIRQCTTNTQRLMAVPNFPNFYYFTDRSFGGGQIIFLPGYFSTQADQQRIVTKMTQQDIPMIVYLRNYVFDDIPDRKFEVAMPLIASYIETNYHSIKRVNDFDFMLRNNLVIKKRGVTLMDSSCPVAAP